MLLCEWRLWLYGRRLVGELGCVWLKSLILDIIVDRLAESCPHSYVVGEVCGKLSIKVGIAGLKVCCEPTVLHWQIVIFFLIHFLVDNILLGDT